VSLDPFREQVELRHYKNCSVRNISFSVSSGDVFALLGLNGAGKTTLLNHVLGLYKLSSGRVEIQGYNIHAHQDQIYRQIGNCPQQEIFWPKLTAQEHLFYRRLKDIAPKDEKEVKQYLEHVELPEKKNLPKHLSGGQRMRLAIGIAIMANLWLSFKMSLLLVHPSAKGNNC
jgi:ATP-binding cassette, subfamily A (ABC1), member 3